MQALDIVEMNSSNVVSLTDEPSSTGMITSPQISSQQY